MSKTLYFVAIIIGVVTGCKSQDTVSNVYVPGDIETKGSCPNVNKYFSNENFILFPEIRPSVTVNTPKKVTEYCLLTVNIPIPDGKRYGIIMTETIAHAMATMGGNSVRIESSGSWLTEPRVEGVKELILNHGRLTGESLVFNPRVRRLWSNCGEPTTLAVNVTIDVNNFANNNLGQSYGGVQMMMPYNFVVESC
ncbi:hypothetical protein TetV_297 [Tetraselmis virus 1]|uniref:Lipoprotein n=1 Tax=Tetraselmis virus 1 TaxID=2060617 RepID=A0A2P0VNR6_9VIRU|nr:hypothetical protein QJ968_gp297 [Tetraselmis virus 1]AUF82389.1 hypothetical protein TetV_297 [Tetraselmis virus 1]